MKNKTGNCYAKGRLCCGLLFALLLFLCGCGQGQPALTKNASVFKKDALETIGLLSPEFTALLAQNKESAVKPALVKRVSDAAREGTPFKFRIMVLNRMGIKLAGGLSETNDGMNFSSYSAAQTVLQENKMAADVFYLGNAKVYVVSAPLIHAGTVVGGVVLGVFEQELKDRWHITEKEFREIDFN
jgi:hypothetical protein